MIGAIALLAAFPIFEPQIAAKPNPVGTLRNAVLRDESRRRTIPLFITYPTGSSGPFPVIVFSHGAGGAGPNVAGITSAWSERGYVCINPSHQDQQQREEGSQAVTTRVRDVKHILDSFGELMQRYPELSSRIDGARVGIAGHSLGALTAQIIAGAKAEGGDLTDERPRAFILLSPQGVGMYGLTESSWSGMARPALSVTGSLDRGMRGQGPEWRMDPFRLSPAGDKFHLYFEGAHHGSFTGRYASAGAGPRSDHRQADIFSQLTEVSAAFWDAYLKGSDPEKKKLAAWSAEGAVLSRR
jgi:dienelactone hydrolase